MQTLLSLSIRIGLSFVAAFAVSCSGGQEGKIAPGLSEQSSPELIEKGRYLAAAGDCVSCHTSDDGEPFAGGHEFHTPFGIIYSTNITPDENAGIGAWTLSDFEKAMRKGVDPKGRHLYPVFPYTDFTKITDEDIAALYAYFQSLPSHSYEPPANKLNFPFGWRTLLGPWKALHLKTGPFEPDESRSEEWNRGAYLVEGLGHCGACHTPRNFMGAEKDDRAFAGATYLDYIENTGEHRPWAAVNLTPAAAGLAAWSEKDIADYLKTGHSAMAGTFGPMNKVIAKGTSQLTKDDVQAMAVYLKSLPPQDVGANASMSPDELREGERLYSVHCGTCHLPTGAGDPTTGPPLKGSAIVQAQDPASLINVIIYGAQIAQPAPEGAWKSMEAFGDKLDDEEVAILATYMRASWGNSGSNVSERDVEKQR
ncbi:cytochrome c [Hyphococcus sp.]|uniref:cytochrome c n=1 Tax=Hyphococcus sp. TaxID=2038636 RepID=UPI003CCC0732